ncbi:hypothetical protein BdWA1_002668 [Babesia duncani]|uniref:Uncharacterized protein n=1 Tax=Babesia duncani TaxID=323732 RepID=A0AAD9PJX2_9APIC|nr:hypothetical protein BdWA1_002668 [Babesia duncani]
MSRDISDVSSNEDDTLGDLPEFKREMLLAERHAEQLRLKHQQQLIQQGTSIGPKSLYATSLSLPEQTLEYMDAETLEDNVQIPPDSNAEEKLFDDDNRQENRLLNVALVNTARVSKSGALHILEHPRSLDYLKGALLRIFISGNNESKAKDSVAILFPTLYGLHAVFRIERLVHVEEYHVYGTKFQACDHDEKTNVLGNSNVLFRGTVLSHSGTNACTVSLNDVCNAPFVKQDLINVRDDIAQDLTNIANVLKGFTFTDEDVALILEKRATRPVASKYAIISEIQQINDELQLLSKQVPLQTSKIEALEHRKSIMEAQLKSLKGTKKQEIFAKSYKVLRASNDNATTLRKTTQPTPMIMCPVKETEDSENTRQFKKRTLHDLSLDEQVAFISNYVGIITEAKLNLQSSTNTLADVIATKGYMSMTEYLNL